MSRRLLVTTAVMFLPFGWSAAQPPAARVALVGATLIDGTGAAPIPNATILIEGSRISGGPVDRAPNQMDDDVLDLMAAKGVAIVPTIAIYRHL